jgi:hypothetical protein
MPLRTLNAIARRLGPSTNLGLATQAGTAWVEVPFRPLRSSEYPRDSSSWGDAVSKLTAEGQVASRFGCISSAMAQTTDKVLKIKRPQSQRIAASSPRGSI